MSTRATGAVRARGVRPLLGLVAAGLAMVLIGCGTDASPDAQPDPTVTSTSTAPQSTTPTPSATPTMPSPTSTTTAPPTSSAPAPAPARITIVDFEYRGDMRVSPGQRVRVANDDATAHTLTADAGDSVFDVTIAPGETATFTAPTRPGSFGYYCKFHANMTGTLVVG